MITAISAAVLACGEPDKAAEAEQSPVISAPVSNNPDVFNQSFENLLGSYYDLKDALVEYDTAKANLASKSWRSSPTASGLKRWVMIPPAPNKSRLEFCRDHCRICPGFYR
jgi:hypothetical protein